MDSLDSQLTNFLVTAAADVIEQAYSKYGPPPPGMVYVPHVSVAGRNAAVSVGLEFIPGTEFRPLPPEETAIEDVYPAYGAPMLTEGGPLEHDGPACTCCVRRIIAATRNFEDTVAVHNQRLLKNYWDKIPHA